jgi:hypothetical protein
LGFPFPFAASSKAHDTNLAHHHFAATHSVGIHRQARIQENLQPVRRSFNFDSSSSKGWLRVNNFSFFSFF